MSEYFHHISGRLRLKLAQIKGNPGRAQEISAAVCRIKGVSSAQANAVTGSLLIHYEAAQVDVTVIVNAMTAAGWFAPALDAAPIRTAQTTLAAKVLDSLAEKLIERSAIALLGALL